MEAALATYSVHLGASWPGLSRPSTLCFQKLKTWMPGIKPGMTARGLRIQYCGRHADMASAKTTTPQTYLQAQSRWHPLEIAFWLATLLPFVLFPDYLSLASQIAITALFALSLDLILGYAGIVSLGHAAFFGIGAYTAGLIVEIRLG